MFSNRFVKFRRDLRWIARQIGASLNMDSRYFSLLCAYGGLEILLIHVAFPIIYLGNTFEVPALFMAVDGILLGATMVWVYRTLEKRQFHMLAGIRFSLAACLLWAIGSVAVWGSGVSQSAAALFDALPIIVFQVLDVLVILGISRFLRSVEHPDQVDDL